MEALVTINRLFAGLTVAVSLLVIVLIWHAIVVTLR